MKFADSVFTLALIVVFTRTVHAFIDVTAFHLIVLIKAAVFLIFYNDGIIPVSPLFLKQPTLTPPPVRETLRIEGVTLQVANSLADLLLVKHAELSPPSPIGITPLAPVMLLVSPAHLVSLSFELPTTTSLYTIFSLLPLLRVFSAVKELLPLKLLEFCPSCTQILVVLAFSLFDPIVFVIYLVKKAAAGFAFIKQRQLPVPKDDNDAGDYDYVAANVSRSMDDATANVPRISYSRPDGGSIAALENGKGSPWQAPETLAEIRIAIRKANHWLQANQN